jgi:hypothetical protein
MTEIVCCIVAVAFIATVALWVNGIDYMKNEFPDYKGEDLFGEDPLDEKDSEIKFEDVFNEEKKENLKKFISEHKKNIEKD